MKTEREQLREALEAMMEGSVYESINGDADWHQISMPRRAALEKARLALSQSQASPTTVAQEDEESVETLFDAWKQETGRLCLTPDETRDLLALIRSARALTTAQPALKACSVKVCSDRCRLHGCYGFCTQPAPQEAQPVDEPTSRMIEAGHAAAWGRGADVYGGDIEAIYKAMRAAAPQPARAGAVELTDEDIKRIFLANGFTIKEGLTDLKPYVYQAARALIAAMSATAGEKGERHV